MALKEGRLIFETLVSEVSSPLSAWWGIRTGACSVVSAYWE